MGTSNKPLDFCADPDHDPDPGIFNGNFTTSAFIAIEYFAGSAAVAEVCAPRVLLFFLWCFEHLAHSCV